MPTLPGRVGSPTLDWKSWIDLLKMYFSELMFIFCLIYVKPQEFRVTSESLQHTIYFYTMNKEHFFFRNILIVMVTHWHLSLGFQELYGPNALNLFQS